MKIFIASSKEAIEQAEVILEILNMTKRVEVIPWWSSDAFKPNFTYLESLVKLKDDVDAAIVIFSPDDTLLKRGKTIECARDNILIEYGLFTSALGRLNVAPVFVESPGIPTDLLGVHPINYSSSGNIGQQRDNNKFKILEWLDQIDISKRKKNNMVRTRMDVLTYVFNKLNPYQDIVLTQQFLNNIPNGGVFNNITDVINPLDGLIHNYAKQLIEPYMRIYFAYQLVGASCNEEYNELYRIGISVSDNDPDWRESLKFGKPSNVHRAFNLKGVCRVRQASQLAGSEEQNFPVSDEGSVLAVPVLYSQDNHINECIGVLGVSSPNEQEVTDPKYEEIMKEISVLFSSLFYAYGKSIEEDGNFDYVVNRIRNEVNDHFMKLFD